MGTGSNGITRLRDFWRYDPLGNSWTQVADFGGTARSEAVGFAIGNRGYVGTGFQGSNSFKDFWEYNPETNEWRQKKDVPGPPRITATGFGLAGKGFLGLGLTSVALADFYSYDPTTDAWTKLPDFPGGGRYGSVAFTIGNMGYVGLGRNNSNGSQTTIYPFNPTTGTWGTPIATVSGLEGDGWSSFTLGNRGYVGMGNGSNRLLAYDPAANIWSTKTNYPGQGTGFGIAFAMGNKGYMGTGVGNGGSNNEFWSYMDDNSQPLSSTLPAGATSAITDGAWTLDGGTVYKSNPGNVGIGTNNPNAPLDVVGKFKLGTQGTVLTEIRKFDIFFGNVSVAPNAPLALGAGPFTDLTTNSSLMVSPGFELPVGILLVNARVGNDGRVRLTLYNITGELVSVPGGTYHFTAIK
jgi:N-acetylneuraminic acid mutarotase